MRITFLNCWDARCEEDLAEYFRQEASRTDVFCLQESGERTLSLTRNIFDGYQELFRQNPAHSSSPWYAQAIYVKEGLPVLETGDLFFDEEEMGVVNWVEVPFQESILTVVNIHGISVPGKHDTPLRLEQFQRILAFAKSRPGYQVIGGDFNVLPETESVQMFAREYQDLIQAYGIKTTRNRHSLDLFPGREFYYSDYAFVDKRLPVSDFQVIENEISDHLPLVLEI